MIDLALLVSECAPNIGAKTMMAIVRTESGGYPWALNDNTVQLRRQPVSKTEAVATAKHLIAKGHSVDIGLGQVNSQHLARLGLTVDQVIEPCTNLAASASILTDAYSRATKVSGYGRHALLGAISAYNTGSFYRGFSNGYVQKVASKSGVVLQPVAPRIEYFSTKNESNKLVPPLYSAPLVVHDLKI